MYRLVLGRDYARVGAMGRNVPRVSQRKSMEERREVRTIGRWEVMGRVASERDGLWV